MKAAFVYMTARDRNEAMKIGRALVEERLAACVNIFNHVCSLYWWEGAVQEESEVGFIAKTTTDRIEQLTERVKELHSYSVPCVVAWPVEGGNPAYLEWIREESRPREEVPESA